MKKWAHAIGMLAIAMSQNDIMVSAQIEVLTATSGDNYYKGNGFDKTKGHVLCYDDDNSQFKPANSCTKPKKAEDGNDLLFDCTGFCAYKIANEASYAVVAKDYQRPAGAA